MRTARVLYLGGWFAEKGVSQEWEEELLEMHEEEIGVVQEKPTVIRGCVGAAYVNLVKRGHDARLVSNLCFPIKPVYKRKR